MLNYSVILCCENNKFWTHSHWRHQDFWSRGQRGGKTVGIRGKRKLLLSDFQLRKTFLYYFAVWDSVS